jgi:hypothetical protein
MNRAQITSWLSVGNCHACAEAKDPNEAVIHIFRTDTDTDQRRCCTKVGGRMELHMDYRDGDLLDASNLKNLDAAIKEYQLSYKPQKVLVHCHAGMCRSPTVAIYLLIEMDGMNPYDARALVERKIYEQRAGEICDVPFRPWRQIVKHWEAKQPKPTETR